MDEGRKRVLAIVAGILMARHLKAADDLFDSRCVKWGSKAAAFTG
jgi:hypothetical protein